MTNKNIRNSDLLKLVKGLDITPTMFKNATDKYTALAEHLQKQGLESDIYPQGSFSLGTVVRPYSKTGDVAYDLDFICELKTKKSSTQPKEVKFDTKDAICSNDDYKSILQPECDKCWTLEYAKINSLDFNIDIVPAVPEDEDCIQSLQFPDADNTLNNTTIAITNKKNDDLYEWCMVNPKAYTEWFHKINQPFLEYGRKSNLEMLFEENRSVYNSIEEIPLEMERSSLQRVVQILKRLRDVYFGKIDKEDLKPISAIITTLAVQMAQPIPPTIEMSDLLDYVVQELVIYSENQFLNEAEFAEKYTEKSVIRKQNGCWVLPNPVNPNDNLTDSWNENPDKPKYFFEWVSQLKDLVASMGLENNEYFVALENAFGYRYVGKMLNEADYQTQIPKPIINTPKPWRN